MKIAILGGGISGLSAACHLKKEGVAFDLFEGVHSVGGNARTVDIQTQIGGYSRWTELGVNDFNANGYHHLMAAFKQVNKKLEEMGKKERIRYKPLQDSSSFADIFPPYAHAPRQTGYNIDGQWAHPPSQEILEGMELFSAYIYTHFKEIMQKGGKLYYATIRDLIALSHLAKTHPSFVTDSLYPRISTMYFADQMAPGDMPARTVIGYFALQEGVGPNKSPNPERMYWTEGVSRSWIRNLATVIDPENQQIHTNMYDFRSQQGPTIRRRRDDRYDLITAGGDLFEGGPYDRVIMALQAKDVTSAYHQKSAPEEIKKAMARFRYTPHKVAVHTFTGVMPPDATVWSTYNLNLFPQSIDGSQKTRYSMTYCVNFHQNDGENPAYQNKPFVPLFFNTVNPQMEIPQGCQLSIPGCEAMHTFYHQIMDMDALKAQDELPQIQGTEGVCFAGGYTRGAGLHEECWISGEDAARWAITGHYPLEHCWDPQATGLERFPAYLRKVLNLDHHLN